MRNSLSQPIFKHFLEGRQSHDKIILHDKIFYTYGDTLRYIDAVRESLADYPVTKNQLVGICLHHGINYISAALALYTNQSSLVFINPKLPLAELDKLLVASRLNFILLAKESEGSFPVANWDFMDISNGKGLVLARRKIMISDPISFDSPKIIIFTSGSTGSPNAVVLNEYTLSANVHAVTEYLNLQPNDSSFIYTPPGYVYAVNQTFCHLNKLALQFAYHEGLQYPNHLLDNIAQHKITGLATNPTGLRYFTDPKLCKQDAIDSVRYVMTGGQPLGNALLKKVREKFPSAAVINTYGCTETSARISCWVCPSAGVAIAVEPFPVGFPITGTRIKIVDENNHEVSDGAIGSVLVSGPTIMEGYIKGKTISREKLMDDWFATGDLGSYSNTNGLVLLGRSDDIILRGHHKIAPVEIETVLEAIPGIKEAGVSYAKDELFDAKLIALLVTDPEADQTALEKACTAACRQQLSSFKQPEQYIFADTIPKNLYGKIDRKKLFTFVQPQ